MIFGETLRSFRSAAIVASALGATLFLPGGAIAQQTSANAGDEPQEVVVTGFRASLENALEAKREASGIVDVIRAEDIAKFPDANLAESIQRIPGVSLSRSEGGEGRQITVRGLNAGFTRVRINGIEGVVATGASDISGSTNRGRGFDFSVFASELFNSVDVRKSASADVEEGSLGATVDLRTSRPFDFDGFTLSLGGQALYNDLSQQTQPRFTALISDHWDTFGALVSYAYSRRSAVEEGYEAVELLTANADGGFCSPLGFAPQSPPSDAVRGTDAANCAAGQPRTSVLAAYNDVFSRTDNFGGINPVPAAGTGAFAPRIPRYRRSRTEYERQGLTASLQWRPGSGQTEINFDALLGRFANDRFDNYIEAISFGRSVAQANGKPHSSILEAHFAADGSWDYGKFDGVDIRTEGLLDHYTTDFRQYVLTARHDFTDRLRVDLMVGQSSSDLDEPIRDTVQFDALNVNGYSFDFRANNNVPVLNHVIDVANPQSFTFGPIDANLGVHGQFGGRLLETENTLQTAELNARWKFSDRLALRAGYSHRDNEWDNYEVSFGTGGNNPSLPAGVTLASVSRQIDGFGRGLGATGVPSSWAAVDLEKFLGVLDFRCHCAAVQGSSYDTLNQVIRNVDEKIKAAHAMIDFNFELGPVPIRGDIGVRRVDTDLAATGVVAAGTGRTTVTVDNSYSDTLPSLNASAELFDNFLLRFSAAKTLARPEYVDLTPSTTITSQTQTVAIGNPFLEPIRANTFDLQAEWYFAKGGLLSVGFFHKDIKSFIQGVSERLPYNSLGLADSLLITGNPPCSITGGTPACATLPSTVVTVNRRVNTDGGPLDGFEIGVQAPFTFLPGLWRNLGVLANYTHVKSDITYITRVDNPNTPANELLTQNANFTGLSPNAYNFTLYYDNARFSARVSAAYRDDYLLNVLGNVNGHDVTTVNGTTNIDFSTSYNFGERLRVSLEAQNLTDEAFRYGRDSERNDTLLYVHSGRVFTLGVTYKF